MKKIKLVLLFVLLALLLSIVPSTVLADGPDDRTQIPMCSDMSDAQVPGKKPGSACRVPVVALGKGLQPLRTLYRSGSTGPLAGPGGAHTSESDLWEETIVVTGWLSMEGLPGWYDQCEGVPEYGDRSYCQTNGTGGGDPEYAESSHYFHTSGYVDDHFNTGYTW